MEIKTKYNINDKILFKDDVDNIISATVLRIEMYITDANLGIKYITKYGTVYEDDIIDENEFKENNETNNPIEVITMTFRSFNESIKPKYNINQLVEYHYKGEKYISIIEKITYDDKNITYKLVHDDRNFLETEIKPIKLNVYDNIVYFKPYTNNRILYYCGKITDIYPIYLVIRNDDGSNVCIKYNQILRRI